MNRRLFIFSSAAVLLGSTTGCVVTPALYNSINSPGYRNYTETVNQILFSADGKHLVFIGPKYHYIFDAPNHLMALLNSPLHKKMTATVSGFDIGLDERVTGTINLDANNLDLGEEKQAWALGFPGTTNGHFHGGLSLQGIRYSAQGFNMPVRATQLNQSYTVKVREQVPATGARKALVLLTPLTVAMDGVIMLFLTPVAIAVTARLMFN